MYLFDHLPTNRVYLLIQQIVTNAIALI